VSDYAAAAEATFRGGPLDGRRVPLVVSEAFAPGETCRVSHPDPAALPRTGIYQRTHVYIVAGALLYEYVWDADGGAS
jgi:hypothetical protein